MNKYKVTGDIYGPCFLKQGNKVLAEFDTDNSQRGYQTRHWELEWLIKDESDQTFESLSDCIGYLLHKYKILFQDVEFEDPKISEYYSVRIKNWIKYYEKLDIKNQEVKTELENKVQEILIPMKKLVDHAGYNQPTSKKYFFELLNEMENNIRQLLEKNE